MTTVATADTKTSKLDADILGMSKIIKENLSGGQDTGIITGDESKNKIFEAAKPEAYQHCTAQVIDDVDTLRTKFVAASAHAVGEYSAELLKGNKEINTTEVVLGVGGNHRLGIEVERSRTYPNPKDKDHPVTKHGVMSIDYDTVADNTNAGQLKIARQEINTLCESMLK